MNATAAFADCPGAYAGKSCNGGTGSDICTFTTTSVTCSFADIAGTQGAEGYFYNASSTEFRGFGSDATGELFCCDYTGLVDACNDYTTPTAESFTGTNEADTMKLQYSTYDLKCADPVLHGWGGDDDIEGSRALAVNYVEYLYGDDGSDTIRGDAGLDIIHGGDGPDILWGGDDQDDVYGDAGNDQIKGEDSDDYLDGGIGDDQVCGGPGEDDIVGGIGDDVLFSGVGNSGAQTVDGTSGTDACGSTSYATLLNCDTSSLSACPW